MKQKTAIATVKEWFPSWKAERDRLDKIDSWYRGANESITAPHGATKETKRLIELATTPSLSLVVTAVAQSMFVDGYRTAQPDAPENSDEPRGLITGPWKTWLANGMPARQIAVHRAALAYGYSFVQVMPGVDVYGNSQAVMRGLSPRKVFAVYANQAEDEWPMFYLQFEPQSKDTYSVKVVDEVSACYLTSNADATTVEFIEERAHNATVPPLIRYTNMLDLDGRMPGEVEPFIPLAARIDKTAFDRLVTQHFASWKKMWIAGMEKPSDEQTANGIKIKLAQDDILISDNNETKFGTFEASELSGFISAHEADVKTLAALSQTPSHALTGDLINLSAEALAAARAQLEQKVGERKVAMGGSHEQALRLAARMDGNSEAANDFTGHVTWQDMSIQSLAGAADGLGKLATMLKIPVEALWGRVPGATKTDISEWVDMAEREAERSPEGLLAGAVVRQSAADV